MQQKVFKITYICLPICVMVLLTVLYTPNFTTNDDAYIMKVLSGRIIQTPYYETAFFSVLLGLPLAGLYSVSSIPWYPLFLMLGTLFVQIQLHAYMYQQRLANKVPKSIFVLLSIVSVAYFFYMNTMFTYTVLAAHFGAGAILYLYRYSQSNQTKHLMYSAICLLLSLATRTASGFIGIAFWGLQYLFLLNRKQAKKQLCYGIVILAALGIAYGADMVEKHYIAEPQGYYKFMQAQADFVDYTKKAEPEEFENSLAKVGWDRDLYSMARCYFSMDTRLQIAGYKEFEKYNQKNDNHFKEAIYNVLYPQNNIVIYRYYLSTTVWLGIFASVYILLSKNKKASLLALCINIAFAALLYIYGKNGRIYLRANLAIYLPYIISLISLLCSVDIQHINKMALYFVALLIVLAMIALFSLRISFAMLLMSLALMCALVGNNKRLVAVIALCTCAVFIYFSYKVPQEIHLQKNDKYAPQKIERRDNFYRKHEDKLIVTDLMLSGDFRMFYTNEALPNLLFWGGTNAKSYIMQKQLSMFGVNEYDISALTKDNVYLLTTASNADFICRMLETKNIKATWNLIDTFEEFSLVKIN